MHLFIDTNTYLSFYHYASDDLEELKKLIVLLQQKKLTLYLPEQVVQEFNRNRENKIADAMKRFRDQRLNLQFPQVCKDYDEYATLRKLQKDYEEHHAALLNKLREAIADRSLKADEITAQLFKLAKRIPCPTDLLQRARTRSALGNPPGKSDSLGDAVNWEALLSAVPNGAALNFITDDDDYCSPLDDDQFNGYLLAEWTSAKKSELTFYRRLSQFFSKHFPEIKLAAELEKELLIRDLAHSGSFSETHAAIAKLSQVPDFTKSQINALATAGVDNSQVYMIMDDDDVFSFFSTLVHNHAKSIDPKTLLELKLMLAPPKKATPVTFEDDDIPF